MGRLRLKISEAIYEGTRAWGGASDFASGYFCFSFLNIMTWHPLDFCSETSKCLVLKADTRPCQQRAR